MHRNGAIILSLVIACPAIVWGAAPPLPPSPNPPSTAPAPPPAAPTTAPTTAPAPKAGETVTVDALLDYYAERFGIIFARNGPLTKEVTLRRDIPSDPEAAVAFLNDVLETQSLGTWRVHRNPAPGEATSGRILLQVLTLNEVKVKQRDESPVTSGTDPAHIDVSDRDRIITHLVPINNANLIDTVCRAAQEEKDVTATVLGSAELGYQLVLTGPALSVKHALASVIKIDTPGEKIVPVVRNMHLENIDAAGCVTTINQLYGPNILGDKSVRAVADIRTNTIILTGPEASVLRVIGDLTVQDQGPLPPPRNRPPAGIPPPTGAPGGRMPDSLLPLAPPTLAKSESNPAVLIAALTGGIVSNNVQNCGPDAITVHPAIYVL